MKYDPDKATDAWPEGTYDATFDGHEDKRSKSGNEMTVLAFTVYDNSGRTTKVEEYVTEKALWKLKRFASAVGQSEAFKSGDTAWLRTCAGSNLKVELGVQESDDYGDRNFIGKFIKSEAGARPVAAGPHTGPLDEDPSVPF